MIHKLSHVFWHFNFMVYPKNIFCGSNLSIPKKMKKVGMVFYGRTENLNRILELKEMHSKHQELSNYFFRNAFLSNSEYINASEAFVSYTLGFEELLETLSVEEIEDFSFNASEYFT